MSKGVDVQRVVILEAMYTYFDCLRENKNFSIHANFITKILRSESTCNSEHESYFANVTDTDTRGGTS